MVWYSHLSKNFPQFIVIHTVKGFGIVNKAQIDVFLECSCFFLENNNPHCCGRCEAHVGKRCLPCGHLQGHVQPPFLPPRSCLLVGVNQGVQVLGTERGAGQSCTWVYAPPPAGSASVSPILRPSADAAVIPRLQVMGILVQKCSLSQRGQCL